MSVWRLVPLTALTAALIVCPAAAQSNPGVVWSFTARKIGAKIYEVHMTATIVAGWHLYSQASPWTYSSTHFTFMKSPWVIPVAKTAEVGKLIISPDTAFDAKQRYYQDSVDFVQKVEVNGKAPAALKGSVRFAPAHDYFPMVPATKDFTVALK